MTEKHYGGQTSHGLKNKTNSNVSNIDNIINKRDIKSTDKNDNLEDNNFDIEKLKKAGKILSEVKEYSKSIIKPGMKLLEIAEKIESKIYELKAKPAFPVNLSINEVAAHDTPSFNDERIASGLLKVDVGVHIQGNIADSAFSLDLENNEENKSLIKAAEEAVNNAVEKINYNVKINEIGNIIEKTIKSFNLQPIQNLSGHSIDLFNLHAGITIPNFDNTSDKIIQEGVYAIEPFSTSGLGRVRDGKPSGIYHLEKQGNVRDSFAREVLSFIIEEYSTLPFCSRWIHKKFGTRGLLALKQIEQSGLLHHYPQLIESGKGKVAQAEHTIIILKDKKIITTI